MTEKKMQIKPYPLGAHHEFDYIRFSCVSKEPSCGILLYDRATGKRINRIPFSQEERLGNIYCKYVWGLEPEKITYQFYQGEEVIPDEHARAFLGGNKYGKTKNEKDMRAVFFKSDFEWDNTARPGLSYAESICYCMHVRGFTKHPSSGVEHRGTFLGIVEKLPYLKDSGITTLELQPAYEFTELPTQREIEEELGHAVTGQDKEQLGSRLNYWGYKKGYYYAPKAAYASGEDAAWEFKTLVRELHRNQMELVMQFYFPKSVNRGEIAEILRFWVLEYQVDGFRLMGEDLPIALLAKDPALVDTKLWFDWIDTEAVYGREESPTCPNLAEYRDDYLYTMRRFLKGDEDMLSSVLYQMRHIPKKAGRIHFMSNYFGFTLMDMVSYDYKHNEENGQDNRDGNDYNASWNCGEEGITRKKKILALRHKQLKNAMCMLLLSQSTPLIFMGDEFGNTQYGNNNPYCQDNKTTWLDWRGLEKQQEIYAFWKQLVAIRKEHPILSPKSELRIMDYLACGYPDLSYHGRNAWRPQLESYYRYVGMMYCGKYATKKEDREDAFLYVGLNMHWEPHELALPKLPKGLKWVKLCTTAEGIREKSELTRLIPERSVVVFKSEADNE